MTSQTAQIAYLLLTALAWAFITRQALRRRTAAWTIAAALVWVGLFVGLTYVAESMGWHLP